MWKKIKPTVTKLVIKSIKSHWIFLGLVIFIVYQTGEMMSEKEFLFNLTYRQAKDIHAIGAKVVLIITLFLGVEKVYLYLNRKGLI